MTDCLSIWDGDGLLDLLRTDTQNQPFILFGGFQSVSSALVPFPPNLSIRRPFDSLRILRITDKEYHTEHEFIDVTGDGRPDLVTVSREGQKNHCWVYTDEPSDDAPFLLKTVDNGRGLVGTYHYAPSSDSSVVKRNYTPDTAALRLLPNLPFNVWVVKRLDVVVSGSSDAPATISTTTYEYENPVYLPDLGQRVGAQFRGFESVRVHLPKTTADPAAPQQLSRYDYHLDPSGLLQQTIHYEAVPAQTPGSFNMVERTIDTSTYVPVLLLGGTTRFVYANSKVHCECDPLAPSEQDCERIGHRTVVRDKFVPDSPAQRFYFQQWHLETADGSPQRGTWLESIYVDNAGTYLVLPKRKMLCEAPTGTADFASGFEGWMPLRKEEFFYDGSTNPDQFGGIYGSLKGLQTAHRIYRDVAGNADPVVNGIGYDARTGQVTNVVRPSNMQLDQNPDQLPGTRVTYDIWLLFPVTSTNELYHQTAKTYDLGTGGILTQKGPNSKQGTLEETDYECDGFGRLLKETVSIDTPLSYAHQVRRTFQYLDEAPVSRVIEWRRIEWNEDRYIVVTRSYNGAGRLIEEQVGTHDQERPNFPLETHRYEYDERGAMLKIEGPDPSKDEGLPLVAFRFQRDSRNRITRLSSPNGSVMNLSYAPWQRTIRDEDGNVTHEVSDGLGQLREVDQSPAEGRTASTLYEYDGTGQLTKIIDAGDQDDLPNNPSDPRQITSFKYDGKGNRTHIIRPGARQWKYEYDLDSNVKRHTDPDGRVMEFHYDLIDRLKEKVPIESLLTASNAESLGIGRVIYDYDSGAGSNLVGRLVSVSFFAGSQTNPYAQVVNDYDAQGNVTSETWSWNIGPTGPQKAVLKRTYNALPAISQLEYPSGAKVTYGYDYRGLIETVSTEGKLLANYSYNMVRGMKERRSDFSQNVACTYDPVGRLKSYDLESAGKIVLHRKYDYSRNGDVISIGAEDHLQPGPGFTNWTYQFRYDEMHRLKHTDTGDAIWSGAKYQADFEYTPSGKLNTAKIEGPESIHPRDVIYFYGDGAGADPQAVTFLRYRSGDHPLAENSYDSSGNLVRQTIANRGTVEFAYDVNDMNRSVSTANESERYFYAEGPSRFLVISSNGNWRFSLADEYEMSVSGTLVRKSAYVQGSDELIARIDLTTAPSEPPKRSVMFLHQDRRGDILAAIDDAGNSKSHYIYGAYGELLWAAGDLSENLRYGFTGKEWDQISGFWYYGYRYYDPLLIRWTSADPVYRFPSQLKLANPQRLNLYAFCINNPLRYRDPNGLDGFNPDPSLWIPNYQPINTGYEGGTMTTSGGALWAGLKGKYLELWVQAMSQDLGTEALQGILNAAGDKSARAGAGNKSARAGATSAEGVLGDPVNMSDSQGVDVFLCKRPARIDNPFFKLLGALGFDMNHWWIKTGEYEFGVRNAPGAPDGYGTPTVQWDQSGAYTDPQATCRPAPPSVVEGCVNSFFSPGADTGPWTISNNCQSFVKRIFHFCDSNFQTRTPPYP